MTTEHSIQGKDSSQELGRVVCDWLNCQGCPDCPDIPFGRPAEEVVAEMKALDPYDATSLPPTDRSHQPGNDNCFCPGCVKVRSDIFFREQFGVTLNVETRENILQHERIDRRAIAQLDYAAAHAPAQDAPVGGVEPDWEAFEAARMSIEIDETALKLGAILERTDLRPILYAQKVNYIAARPNGGKSWLSYKTAIQVIQTGGRVIFLDYDNKRPDVLSRRVRDMGYSELFKRDDVYFADIYQWTNPAVRAAAAQWLLAADYPVNSTIIIDTDTSAGAANDGSDIREWWESFITPWNKLEIGMLVLAHLPKREEETHGPMGSQDKRGLLDGASYLLETAIAWNAEQGGVLHLRVDKDRHGQLPAVEGEVAADVVAEWLGIL